ncbi:hypothetical protein B0H10DRAFT_2005397 [Mycena sp. CBHHK59/15]|nr:hypothetical protein B0H10DRAFT_2005397 [Mycena sp. CBHHK59/15]
MTVLARFRRTHILTFLYFHFLCKSIWARHVQIATLAIHQVRRRDPQKYFRANRRSMDKAHNHNQDGISTTTRDHHATRFPHSRDWVCIGWRQMSICICNIGALHSHCLAWIPLGNAEYRFRIDECAYGVLMRRQICVGSESPDAGACAPITGAR